MKNIKSSYFLINGFRPVESIGIDNIDFIKYAYNTNNVMRISYNNFSKIEKLYAEYILKASNILNGKE